MSKPKTLLDWERELGTTTDRLGMPIDKEIFPVVVACNYAGLETEASCAGHLDHGLPYPWIDFPQKFLKERQEVHKRLFPLDDRVRALLNKNKPVPDNLQEKRIALNKQTYELDTLELKPIYDQLEAFYIQHTAPYGCMLVISEPRFLRLMCIGSDQQHTRTKGDRKKHLELFREELRMFGEFLKSS
jgi:hypothetical protein